MSEVLSYNEYLLVEPDGTCKGFTDYEGAKSYVNMYYERFIDHKIVKNDYNDLTDIGGEAPRVNICTQAGAETGICKIYKIDDFIKKIESDIVFEEEQEEIISKLIQKDIDFNINDYNLDLVLADIESVDIMEQYGEMK